jgi:hypothetical protein
VHFVFGVQDVLTAAFMSSELPGAIGGPRTTAVRVPDAGHMVHFDRPRYRAIYHGEGMKIYARRTGFDGPPVRTLPKLSHRLTVATTIVAMVVDPAKSATAQARIQSRRKL